jgi:hypothetical protein
VIPIVLANFYIVCASAYLQQSLQSSVRSSESRASESTRYHLKYFSMDSFEIGPTSSDYDMILPFWWMAKHPPSRPYSSPNEIQFNQCTGCSAQNANDFSLEIHSNVLDNPEALIVGSIFSIDNQNSLSLILLKFNKWLYFMTMEAAR